MAARFARSLFLLSLIGLFTVSCRADDGNVTERARVLASEKLEKAVSLLNEAIESCAAKSKPIAIPHWKEIGVDRGELLLGVSYFNLKNENACLEAASKDFALAAGSFKRSHNEKPASGKTRKAFEFLDLMLEDWWKELEAKARYHTEVSESDRAIIEQIPGLHEPFDMIRSWKTSGN